MKRNGIILLIGCLIFAASTSCNHHKADVVYPACDTTNISLSNDLRPILVANCYNCHSAVNAPIVGDNYNLEDFNTLVTNIDFLILAIEHDTLLPAHQFMPKNGSKLSDCDINKFIAWKNQGKRNN